MRYLDIPVINWQAQLLYFNQAIFFSTPNQGSYALPVIGGTAKMANTLDSTSIFYRLTNTVPPAVMPKLYGLLYVDKNFPPAMHGDILREGYRTVGIGYGFEGFAD
jgi:hypothetical protein